MDVIENYMVEDFVVDAPEDERQNRKDRMRAEIIRYNEEEPGSYTDDTPTIPEYIEPTSDGYPGLDAPLG